MNLPPEYHTTVFLIGGRPLVALPSKFAIITAWNPMNRKISAAENELEDEALRRSLELEKLPYFRATGCSPDLSHREPGWAIEMAKSEAIELARRYGQLALWWVENGELHLVSCHDGSEQEVGNFELRMRVE